MDKWDFFLSRNNFFSTAVVLIIHSHPQPPVDKFFNRIYPQHFSSHSTMSVDKFLITKGFCYFLVAEQESNQRTQPKGGFLQSRPPLETPSCWSGRKSLLPLGASVPTCALPSGIKRAAERKSAHFRVKLFLSYYLRFRRGGT